MLDRFGLDKQIQNKLNFLETSDFDIFEFSELVKNKEMEIIACFLMDKHELFTSLAIDPEVFHNFAKAIQAGYVDIPYHNQTHGIDVCQTSYYFVQSCGLKEIADMKDLDLASMIVGTVIHDFEHFGYNNAFLIESQHDWAVTYNDKSVCENHHVAAAFNLLKR